jgi:hypothetical protein
MESPESLFHVPPDAYPVKFLNGARHVAAALYLVRNGSGCIAEYLENRLEVSPASV